MNGGSKFLIFSSLLVALAIFVKFVFLVFMQMAHCNVTLIDDGAYEASETFTVRLGDATGEKWYGARVGDNDRVSVTVTNDEDGKLAPTDGRILKNIV